MIKNILFTLLFICSLQAIAQEIKEPEKIKLYSIGTTLGPYISESANNFGIQNSLFINFRSNKNFFELNVETGIFGAFADQRDPLLEELKELFTFKFLVVSSLYGRNILDAKKIQVLPYVGVSYVYATDNNESAIGFPMKLKIGYSISDRLNLGINSDYLISKIDDKLAFGLFFAYVFD